MEVDFEEHFIGAISVFFSSTCFFIVRHLDFIEILMMKEHHRANGSSNGDGRNWLSWVGFKSKPAGRKEGAGSQ